MPDCSWTDVMKLMTGLEADQVAVNKGDWDAVLSGSEAAKQKMKRELQGLEIYFHAFPLADDQIVVSLRDLEGQGVLEFVTLDCGATDA